MDILEILKNAVEKECSDIFITAGRELSFKQHGVITKVATEITTQQMSEQLIRSLYELSNRPISTFMTEKDDDFSISIQGLARFRVNTYYQRGSIAAVIRVVQFGIPKYSDINIPQSIIDVSKINRGLVLITGSAGSGKSTTLACIIDVINKNRNVHIVTIEDPIEYVHRNEVGVVSQRELNTDTFSYARALRATLREAPDVILVGEMRDLDTIKAAITAAETGHLVLSTLHTLGAANTIDRIIDIFPSNQQQQIRVELAQVLKTVISQQLLPNQSDNGLIPAFEIMNANSAIRTLIRESRIHQINSSIQMGQKEGMILMDDYILDLYKNKRISKETAVSFCLNSEQMMKKL